MPYNAVAPQWNEIHAHSILMNLSGIHKTSIRFRCNQNKLHDFDVRKLRKPICFIYLLIFQFDSCTNRLFFFSLLPCTFCLGRRLFVLLKFDGFQTCLIAPYWCPCKNAPSNAFPLNSPVIHYDSPSTMAWQCSRHLNCIRAHRTQTNLEMCIVCCSNWKLKITGNNLQYLQIVGPIQKLMQTLFELFDLEPIRFECHHIWSSILFIKPGKIFLQPSGYFIGIVIV